MPQSFAIGPGVLEDGGNLEEVAANTRMLLQIIALLQRQNVLLAAINVSLGKMGPEYTEPDEVLDLEVN